ncbi:MAG: flagellar protein FlaG [Candidatus Kapaibacterium sp.]
MINAIQNMPATPKHNPDNPGDDSIRYGERFAEVLANYRKISREDRKSLDLNKALEQAPENKKNVDFKQLEARLRSLLDEQNLTIEFSIDEDTEKMIMKLIDNETQEIVQQFPPEITLKIAKIVASTLGSGQITNAKI